MMDALNKEFSTQAEPQKVAQVGRGCGVEGQAGRRTHMEERMGQSPQVRNSQPLCLREETKLQKLVCMSCKPPSLQSRACTSAGHRERLFDLLPLLGAQPLPAGLLCVHSRTLSCSGSRKQSAPCSLSNYKWHLHNSFFFLKRFWRKFSVYCIILLLVKKRETIFFFILSDIFKEC